LYLSSLPLQAHFPGFIANLLNHHVFKPVHICRSTLACRWFVPEPQNLISKELKADIQQNHNTVDEG
jgi:hypothetical protein